MNEEQILDAFIELLQECAPESPEEVNAFLVESGFDLAQIDAEIDGLMESLKCGAQD